MLSMRLKLVILVSVFCKSLLQFKFAAFQFVTIVSIFSPSGFADLTAFGTEMHKGRGRRVGSRHLSGHDARRTQPTLSAERERYDTFLQVSHF